MRHIRTAAPDCSLLSARALPCCLLQRPSAEEALRHPFLASGSKSVAAERAAGAPLGRTVVSRIQVG